MVLGGRVVCGVGWMSGLWVWVDEWFVGLGG